MQNLCPKCHLELDWQLEGYFCQHCNTHFEKEAFCDICSQKLEKLKACGAVNYFCEQCNELKSKSKILVQFNPK